MIEVTITKKEGAPELLRFDKSSVMLGRAPGNDICLEVSGISRYHARLSVENGTLTIEDLGSTNGTFLNSNKIQSQKITEDDRIAIGSVILQAVFVPSEDRPEDTLPKTETSHTSSELQKITPLKNKIVETPDQLAEGKKPSTPGVEFSEGGDSRISSEENFYWQSLKSFLSPVWEYLLDDSVTEIMINGPEEIYFEKGGRIQKSQVQYNHDQLQAAVLNIAQYVGRRVSEEEPYLDARLPDGSRVAILLPPCSRKGISLSIRKFSKEKLTLQRLLSFGSISEEMIEYIRAAVLLKKNILVSGGTSSGKTSLLNVVSGLIPNDERIITIEDSAELQLSQEHVLPMETKPPDKKGRGQVTIRDLVKASLRMRPDRIIVGEIRGGEALDLLQAMNTGHSGSMATVHASSSRQALTRMETLALFSGIEIPIRALREQVSTAIEIIIQASRLPDHTRKVISISEVNKLSDAGEYQVTDIFRFVRQGLEKGKIIGQHAWTGAQTGMLEEMELAGLSEMVKFFKQAKA